MEIEKRKSGMQIIDGPFTVVPTELIEHPALTSKEIMAATYVLSKDGPVKPYGLREFLGKPQGGVFTNRIPITVRELCAIIEKLNEQGYQEITKRINL